MEIRYTSIPGPRLDATHSGTTAWVYGCGLTSVLDFAAQTSHSAAAPGGLPERNEGLLRKDDSREVAQHQQQLPADRTSAPTLIGLLVLLNEALGPGNAQVMIQGTCSAL